VKIKARSKKSLFQKNPTTKVELEINFPKPLDSVGPVFCDLFNRASLPLNATINLSKDFELKNYRGRQLTSGSEEELLFISGNLVEISEEGTLEEKLDISCDIKSKFLRSDGKKSIFYLAKSELPEVFTKENLDLSFIQIFRLLPVSWKELRFGIEIFKPSFFGSMLGSAPLIVKRLYLDLNLKGIKVMLEDSSNKKTKIPFLEEEVITALEESLAWFVEKKSISSAVNKELYS